MLQVLRASDRPTQRPVAPTLCLAEKTKFELAGVFTMTKTPSVFTILMIITLAGSSLAQDSKPTAARRERDDRTQASRLDTVTDGANIRASQLMGMNIQNSAGEGVGEVKDLVLDFSNGKIKYVAVTYGGFLGIGNKMFAVPFAAFKVKPKQSDRADMALVLDVTKKQMEGAVGFDEDHWPNFADAKFEMELHKRYGVQLPKVDKD
jgi:sporulation protein YlmC with PRC-barrel domain